MITIDNVTSPQLIEAVKLHRQGQLERAILGYQEYLKVDPTNQLALGNLAAAYCSKGEINQSLNMFQKAINFGCRQVSTYFNYGMLLLRLGKTAKAIQIFKHIIKLNPVATNIYDLLGSLLIKESRFLGAIEILKQGLSVDPTKASLYHHLGDALKAEGCLNEAAVAYRLTLCLDTNDYIALGNLGSVYKNLGDYNQAEKCLTKALAIDSRQKMVLYNLGIVNQQKWQFAKAFECFDKAITLDRNFAEAVRNKYLVSRQLCDFKMSRLCEPELDRLLADDPFISIIRHDDFEKNLLVARRWSRELSANIPKNLFKFRNKKDRKKIHLGYLSNDFRAHPIGMMTAPLFKLHNREKFIVSAYSYGADDRSIYRQMIEKEADRFIDLRNLGIYEAAKKINDDGVDILIDLTGYTENHRLEIMAFRPVPVQITWLGFPGTSGADFIDYLIADRVIIPLGAEKYFSEKVIILPHCYQINDFQPLSVKFSFSRMDLGLPQNAFIFASFNQSYKIDSLIWQTWMNILKRVENSVLCLWQQAPEATKNLLKEAGKLGVGKERFFFWESVPKETHLARIAQVDLALDTLVYGGHTTTTDCLRMGVPVITKTGRHFASRVCTSILTEVGLQKLAVESLTEYEDLAVSLAESPDLLKSLKERLTKDQLAKNLFNTERFVKSLEAAYERCFC